MSKKSSRRVIIVGGGYAGINVARLLDAHADVTLVEPKSQFVHNVAAIRSLVQPGLLDQLLIPYDRLLKNGAVVQGKASKLNGSAVELADGQALQGDAIVIATGAGYAIPFKAHTDSIADFRSAQEEAGAAILEAQSIAIVGGGPVGIELAGEIAQVHPRKEVTLISSGPSLLPDYNPRLGTRLVKDLSTLGVDVKLNALVTDLPQISGPFGPATLSLSDGGTVSADLVFPAIGSKPEASLLQGADEMTFDTLGRVATDPWMRLPGTPNIFALGDAANAGEAMTIVAITRQAPWLAKTIRRMLDGKAIEKMKPYAPWPTPPLLVPVGPKRGASVLPLGRDGWVVGPFVTSRMKGRDLFLPRYLKEFGY